ncbi:MAG: aminoglycoside phosphotransferase family protein [Lentisphaeria bacterium]|nr:aminoglycoside phosphotransferase family protein [Lentisphaeria bacterium]
MSHEEINLDSLKSIGAYFDLPGAVTTGAPYGNGHINDTYLARAGSLQFVFQRVNHLIFQDVPLLMNNIQRVTDHLRLKIHDLPPRLRQQVLTLVPAKNGDSHVVDPRGDYWRVYEYLEGTETLEQVDTPERARDGARSFAVFQSLLMDFPSPSLHETIPDFHHTPRRLEQLKQATDEDARGRLKSVLNELDFVLEREGLAEVLVNEITAGNLPIRITHNDTKINNIRFDCGSGKGNAVIDLDTVMPGLIHYDFGDMIRTCCFEGEEDGGDIHSIRLRQDVLTALIQGFLEGAGSFLTPAEMAYLPVAGRLICLEIGIRFLTDYLQGDTYFKTSRPDQNLDRARVQFQRVKLLEKEDDTIRDHSFPVRTE